MSNQNSDYYFLRGGGEMGELIRAKDWSNTSLGGPAGWPQSLRTMVAVMLDNPFGMYIAWGSDYTQLYNDAYRPILGSTKHPHALGNSTRQTFSEIWHIIESMFDGVMNGKAVGFPDFMLPLNRNGFVEECYFDFSYSPIRKDNGQVGGVLVTVLETTNKKKAEESLQQSEQRFRDTVKQAPVGIVILRGRNHVVEMANDAYLRLIDRKEAAFVGKPLFESLPELEESVHALLETVLDTGRVIHGNEVPMSLDRYGKKEVLYFDFLYHPLTEKDGEISGIIVTVTEVSEKVAAGKRIKENEKLLHSIFFNAPVAIAVITGPEHTYLLANNDYQAMVGRTSEQLVGKNSREIFPELVGTGTFEIFDGIYETGDPFSLAEYPVRLDKNNDGNMEQLYFRFSAVPLKDTEEQFNSIIIVAVDITEQVVARKKIEESEQRFQLLVRDATSAIAVLTGPEMKVEIVNEAYARLINVKPHELLGKPLFSIVPDAEEYYLPLLESVLQTGEMLQLFDSPYSVTVNGNRKEGFLHAVYQPYRNTDGKIIGVMVILQDVTEAVSARKKIEQSEKKFEAAILAVEGIIWTNNANGEMIGEQPGWAKLTGQRLEEYQGHGWATAVHPDDAQPTVQAWEKAVADRSTFEFEHRLKTKQGDWKLYAIKAVPVFDEQGAIYQWVGVHTDITEQKLAEQKLSYRTALLEAHNEASVDGVIIVDAKGKILSFNQRFVEIWNIPRHILRANDDDAALSFAMTQLVHPQQFIDKVKYLYEHPMETSHDVLEFKNGKIIERNGYPVLGENSIYYGWSWIFKDITAQKNYEKTIIENEKRFRLLADSMPQHIWTSDPEGNLNYYNQSVFDYSGLTADQIYKGGWIQIVHPDDRELNIKEWMNSINTGKEFLFEHRFRRHDGAYEWQLSRAIPQKDEDGIIQMWVGTSTNIQEQKTFANELERQVYNRTRELADANMELESKNKELESFAYISSHDLQEPLRKIQTFATRILEKEYGTLSANGKDYLKRMQDAANRMQTLIQDLLVYSQSSRSERNYVTTPLNSIIDEVKVDLSEELKDKQATIEATGLCDVKIIPFQFRQLMYNLIGNALKFALPNKPPQIIIKSKIDNGINLNNEKLQPGNKYCHITVSDNGIGFEQKYSERIFEVFQRLHGKNEYNGTGIGLSIVKKIVDNHEGIITAKSELNKGATFDIYIPSTQED